MAWVPDQQKNSIDLTEGETQLISYQGNRVWMTRVSNLQKQQLTMLSSLVHQDTGCDVSQETCFVQSETDRQGILLLYLKEKPDVLSKNQEWFGGFLNPATNAVYDLLGRGYLSNPTDSPKTVFFKQGK